MPHIRRGLGPSRVRLRTPSPPPRSNTPPNHSNLGLSSSRRSTLVSLSPSQEDVDLVEKLEDAQAQICELESEQQILYNIVEAAGIHGFFTGQLVRCLERKLERSITPDREEKEINTASHVLTYEEGQTELEADEEEWQRRLEVMQKKAREDWERQLKQPDFSGTLRKKKKAELSDIAASLLLDKQGTVAALIERIQTFLRANIVIRYSKRYAGLQLDHPHLRGTKQTTPGHLDDNANPRPGWLHKRPRIK